MKNIWVIKATVINIIFLMWFPWVNQYFKFCWNFFFLVQSTILGKSSIVPILSSI